jgi:hypothetical protein
MEQRVVSSIAAAVKYEVPANIVLAVAEKEGGKPGQWAKNTDGTQDVGIMQFNTRYLSELAPYGITPTDVAAAGCYSVELATWRLRQHILNDRGMCGREPLNTTRALHSTTPSIALISSARRQSGPIGCGRAS